MSTKFTFGPDLNKSELRAAKWLFWLGEEQSRLSASSIPTSVPPELFKTLKSHEYRVAFRELRLVGESFFSYYFLTFPSTSTKALRLILIDSGHRMYASETRFFNVVAPSVGDIWRFPILGYDHYVGLPKNVLSGHAILPKCYGDIWHLIGQATSEWIIYEKIKFKEDVQENRTV